MCVHITPFTLNSRWHTVGIALVLSTKHNKLYKSRAVPSQEAYKFFILKRKMSFRLITQKSLLVIPPATTAAVIAIINDNKSSRTWISNPKCKCESSTVNDEMNDALPNLRKRVRFI